MDRISENTRVETLAHKQKANANRMTYLTIILNFLVYKIALIESVPLEELVDEVNLAIRQNNYKCHLRIVD